MCGVCEFFHDVGEQAARRKDYSAHHNGRRGVRCGPATRSVVARPRYSFAAATSGAAGERRKGDPDEQRARDAQPFFHE